MKLQMKNKLFLAAALILPLLFSGCSNKDKNKTEISFSWWGKSIRREYTLNGLENFQKLHPEITVNPSCDFWEGYEDKFDVLYKDNKTADVMQINFDWLYKYSRDGNGFYDLNKLSGIIELSNFTLSELEYGKMKGKLNALPTAFNSIIPVYDESVFAKYGLAIPETWNDLFNAAKIMSKDGYYIIGTGRKMFFLMIIAWFEQTHGKHFFVDNSTYNLNQADTEEIIRFVKKLLDEKVVYPGILSFKVNDMVKEKIISSVCWCSESSLYADIIKERGGKPVLGNFISTPGSGNSGWYLKPATMYAIKKDCKNPVEAARLINYLLNDSNMTLLQKCEKGIPVSNKSLTVLMEENQLAQLEYLALMKIRFNKTNINKMLPVMENKDIINYFCNRIFAYTSGEATLKESASGFIKDINPVLETFNK